MGGTCVLATCEPQVCELRMVKQDASTFWAQLEANITRDTDGQTFCRITISDISARKQAEQSLRIKSIVFDVSIAAISVADKDLSLIHI